MYKSVDRAKELPVLEPMCNKLDKEWEELISGKSHDHFTL